MRRPRLCWIDIETTGLNPARDRILQAAIVITDTELLPVRQPLELVLHRSPTILNLMPDHVREMHARTGLLDRVAASQLRPEAAYSEMFTYVRDNTVGAPQVILAGSSVHFDRAFIAQWVPRLAALLHYRHLDVSALKHLAQWWGYPPFKPRGTSHLALDDIKNSIAELEFYRSTMMREL